jgi:DNA polymerase-1
MTASKCSACDQGHASEVRRRAKAINFGIIYGISAFGLAQPTRHRPRGSLLPTSRNTLSAFRDPRLHVIPDAGFRRAANVETLFGKCHYPDIKASNASIRSFNERAVINARPCRAPPLTSSAAPW